MKKLAKEKLKYLLKRKHVLFANKCREAAEALMVFAKQKNYKTLIIQEEGGWHTYEKSAKKLGFDVLKAEMKQGKLIREKYPKKKALNIINTNPGYAYVEPLSFYDEIKKTDSIIVNDVVGSIGDETSFKGDFLIGSFGNDKPLTISTGGGFIAFDNYEYFEILDEIIKNNYGDAEKSINFKELISAIRNLQEKKNKWMTLSEKIKKELVNKGFEILNKNKSINIFVKTNIKEKENLIKFCKEHQLEYRICPLYIRTMEDAVSIEIKKTKGE